MKQRSSNPRRATAYHEAGHAVMCRHEGVRLNKVTIVSDESTAGSCGHEKLIRGKYPDTDDSDRMRLKIEKRVRIALAGVIAQKLYNPRSFRNYHASADYEAAVDMALHVSGSAKQAEAWLKWLEICTRDTIQAQWSIVEGLAEALLKESTLNGEQVQRLVSEFLHR
jgi:ATP-dependent Zn protease